MVGFRQGIICDESRSDWPGTGPRPIHWNAWYPAAPAGSSQTQSISDFYQTGALSVDATLADLPEKAPLVLLSHGTGGSAVGLTWLAEALADAGFIVVGADHHGNTGVEEYRAEGFLCWWERMRDLSVLLDDLLSSSFLAGRINPDQIAAAGFSLGGYTVLGLMGAVTQVERFQAWSWDRSFGKGPKEFPDVVEQLEPLLEKSAIFRASWERQSDSFTDRRIALGFTLAPAPTVRSFDVDSIKSITVPVTIAVGEGDEEAPANDCAVWLHELLPNSRLHFLGKNVGHYTLLAMGTTEARTSKPHLFSDHSGVDRGSVHRQVIELALQSLSCMKQQKGRPGDRPFRN